MEEEKSVQKIHSDSCNELTEDVDSLSDNKWDIEPYLEEKLKDVPGALDFFKKLQKLIQKHVKKISKLRNKLRRTEKTNNSTQTDFDVDLGINPEIDKTDATTVINDRQVDEVKSIADDIKEAAEKAVQNTGFVYEETSGMYYDYNTGYYYNAEYGLYYDGTSGTYLKYNPECQSYEFYSQVPSHEMQMSKQEQMEKKTKLKRKNENGRKSKENKRPRGGVMHSEDVEEGECSDSEGSCSEDGAKSDSSDVSKQWPPCMRVIVESSEVPKVKVGSLHIITYNGGTIGREGDHSILLPDINTSKHHLKISFNKQANNFFAVDLGSRNGTLLNGKRMSPSKQESDSIKIVHGSKIQIGTTILLCHVHSGTQTCGHCEPGLIQTKVIGKEQIIKSSRADRHKNELRNLRKMCGVGNYDEDPKLTSSYTDRAQMRRDTVGSQNPHEKTQMASLEDSITKENKGFKLLTKMGWKEGQSLGKDGEGLLEPIKLVSNKGTAGIGSSAEIEVARTEKQNIWEKTQERFRKEPYSNNAFDDLSDE